jgi:hypothetical protein
LTTGAPSWAGDLIGAHDIKKGAVRSEHIKTGAVHSSDLDNEGITSADIADGGISSRDLRDGTIQVSDVAPGVLGARAYTHVTRDNGLYIQDPSRTRNVLSIYRPTADIDRPCVFLPASIPASSAVVITTIDAANTPNSHTATVQQAVGGEANQGCQAPNSIALVVKRTDGSDTSTISFNVMVP